MYDDANKKERKTQTWMLLQPASMSSLYNKRPDDIISIQMSGWVVYE